MLNVVNKSLQRRNGSVSLTGTESSADKNLGALTTRPERLDFPSPGVRGVAENEGVPGVGVCGRYGGGVALGGGGGFAECDGKAVGVLGL